jgi:glutamine amidotransferase
MIAVIDYGGGNLGSLLSALERRNVEFRIVENGVDLRAAGAFGATMDALAARELDTAIVAHIAADRPFLGICVGMQVLFAGSNELGTHAGLGVFEGTVERLTAAAPRIPHMGWNTLEVVAEHPITANLGVDPYVYFLHSFRVAVGAATVAATTHGDRFSSVVARGNVVATQFHPEKSQRSGAVILDNFLALVDAAAATQRDVGSV